MKKATVWILILIMILSLCACGDKNKKYEGIYTAKSGQLNGISIDIEKTLGGTVSLKLDSDSRAELHLGGKDYKLLWSLDGEKLTLTASDAEYTGKLSDSTLTLQNLRGSGIDLTFEKTE